MTKKLVLSGEERDFEIEIDALAWQRAVSVAAAYGWKPGSSGYPNLTAYSNNENNISTEDAQGLAHALVKAIPDIPETRPSGIKEVDLPPLVYFAEDMRGVLEEIVGLCQRGEFVVERL